MLGCKPIDTSIKVNHKFQGGVGKPVDFSQYQRLVRRLIYLSHTRLDIAYFVSIVSQYMYDHQDSHHDVALRILRYLKSTPGKELFFYKNGHLKIKGFTDVDWAGSPDDRRFTSSYCTSIGGNLVT